MDEIPAESFLSSTYIGQQKVTTGKWYFQFDIIYQLCLLSKFYY